MTRLRREELIPLEALGRRECFHNGSRRIVRIRAEGHGHLVKMQDTIRVVPAQRSLRSDNFQTMNWRPLHVVEMHTTYCPIFEFQPDLSDIFDSNFKRGYMSIERP